MAKRVLRLVRAVARTGRKILEESAGVDCCCGNPCGTPASVTVQWSGAWSCSMVPCDCVCFPGAYMVTGTMAAPSSVGYVAALDEASCAYVGQATDELPWTLSGTACPTNPGDCGLDPDPFDIHGQVTVIVGALFASGGFWRVNVNMVASGDPWTDECAQYDPNPDCRLTGPYVDRTITFTGPASGGSAVGTYLPDSTTWWSNGFGSCGAGDATWYSWTADAPGSVVVAAA